MENCLNSFVTEGIRVKIIETLFIFLMLNVFFSSIITLVYYCSEAFI